MNSVLSRMMVIPRPIWIFAIILGFYVWWPFGLAVLVYRMSVRRAFRHGGGQWQFPDMMSRTARGSSFAPPSGNRAFDEYRSETLRRLEDEQREGEGSRPSAAGAGPAGVRAVHGGAPPAPCPHG